MKSKIRQLDSYFKNNPKKKSEARDILIEIFGANIIGPIAWNCLLLLWQETSITSNET